MKLGFRESFQRDLENIQGKYVLRGLKLTIRQIEAAESLTDVGNLKRLSDHQSYFGIELGNYRIGLKVSGDSVVLVRLLHYRDLLQFYNR